MNHKEPGEWEKTLMYRDWLAHEIKYADSQARGPGGSYKMKQRRDRLCVEGLRLRPYVPGIRFGVYGEKWDVLDDYSKNETRIFISNGSNKTSANVPIKELRKYYREGIFLNLIGKVDEWFPEASADLRVARLISEIHDTIPVVMSQYEDKAIKRKARLVVARRAETIFTLEHNHRLAGKISTEYVEAMHDNERTDQVRVTFQIGDAQYSFTLLPGIHYRLSPRLGELMRERGYDSHRKIA